MRKLAFLLFLILNISVLNNGLATTFLAMDKYEMIEKSSNIVVGQVIEKTSFWEGDMIYTLTTIAVSENILGENNSEVSVITAGGRVGNIGRKAFGVVELKQYQEVVLFLKPVNSNIFGGNVYSPVNWQQGKIDIVKGGDVYDQFVMDTIPDQMMNIRGMDISSYAKKIKKPLKLNNFIGKIKKIVKEIKK